MVGLTNSAAAQDRRDERPVVSTLVHARILDIRWTHPACLESPDGGQVKPQSCSGRRCESASAISISIANLVHCRAKSRYAALAHGLVPAAANSAQRRERDIPRGHLAWPLPIVSSLLILKLSMLATAAAQEIFASYDFWLFPPTLRSFRFSQCLWTLGFPCRMSRIPRQSILIEVATISEALGDRRDLQC